MTEAQYQAHLIKRLTETFEGCIVLKNDCSYLQGVPDLLVLYRDRWAMLEVKQSRSARAQPNQYYYVNLFNGMSFGAFIYPENEEEVLRELQRSFSA